jgi:hypothetical protein
LTVPNSVGVEKPFPNSVRQLRTAAFLTREALAARTAELAAKAPTTRGAIPRAAPAICTELKAVVKGVASTAV